MVMEPTRSRGRCVLVVDDDRDIRDMLNLALELGGYQVRTAASGAEALRQLREAGDVGVILLDMMMPEMNGWEFRTRQTLDPAIASVPVVILSGDGNIEQKAAALGAAAYVKKPIDLDTLFATVGRYLAGDDDAPPAATSNTTPSR